MNYCRIVLSGRLSPNAIWRYYYLRGSRGLDWIWEGVVTLAECAVVVGSVDDGCCMDKIGR
jgi:hypothetical protein